MNNNKNVADDWQAKGNRQQWRKAKARQLELLKLITVCAAAAAASGCRLITLPQNLIILQHTSSSLQLACNVKSANLRWFLLDFSRQSLNFFGLLFLSKVLCVRFHDWITVMCIALLHFVSLSLPFSLFLRFVVHQISSTCARNLSFWKKKWNIFLHLRVMLYLLAWCSQQASEWASTIKWKWADGGGEGNRKKQATIEILSFRLSMSQGSFASEHELPIHMQRYILLITETFAVFYCWRSESKDALMACNWATSSREQKKVSNVKNWDNNKTVCLRNLAVVRFLHPISYAAASADGKQANRLAIWAPTASWW